MIKKHHGLLKSLLDDAIKLLSTLFPNKKIYPPSPNYPLLLESFDEIQEKNLWKKLDLSRKKAFQEYHNYSQILEKPQATKT